MHAFLLLFSVVRVHSFIAVPARRAMSRFTSSVPATVAADHEVLITVLPEATPLPEPIRSDEPGTWAHDTMSRRVLTDIIDKVVYGDNEGGAALDAARPALDALRAEIAAACPLTPIEADGGADVAAWNSLLAPSLGRRETWLTAPWLLAEFYLYRRIAAAYGWFGPHGSPGASYDFFAKAKAAGLRSAAPSLSSIYQER